MSDPTCSACACSMRWDFDYPMPDGADGAWVCIGCDDLPKHCQCEPAPLEADVPEVAHGE